MAVWALLIAQLNLLAAVCLHHHEIYAVTRRGPAQVHRATPDLHAAPVEERSCLTCLLIRNSSAHITAARQAPKIIAQDRFRLINRFSSFDSVVPRPVLPRAPPSPEA